MSKYIDAEKLKYEIERRNLSNYHTTTEGYEEELYEIIDSLQQEQAEVDIEKEINAFFERVGMPVYWCNDAEQQEFCSNLARHFWNKGYNARKGGISYAVSCF